MRPGPRAISPIRRTVGAVIDRAAGGIGRIDVLVNNAAYQMTHQSPRRDRRRRMGLHLSPQRWCLLFTWAKAALPFMGAGFVDHRQFIGELRMRPIPRWAPYAATKAAIANFSASLAQLLGEKGIRVNSVAPGPIWTPLIPSTMPAEKVESVRGERTAGSRRSTSRIGSRLCAAGLRRRQLHLRQAPSTGNRRPADPLKSIVCPLDGTATRRPI